MRRCKDGKLEKTLDVGHRIKTAAVIVTYLAATFLPNIRIKAADNIPFPDSTVVAVAGYEIDDSTISSYGKAWEEIGDGTNSVYYMVGTDPTIHEIEGVSNARDPNLDGRNLVIASDNGVYLYNIETHSGEIIRPVGPDEIFSGTKINGLNIVYHMRTSSGDKSLRYNIDEEMEFPVSNSSEEQNEPDIYNHIVAWPELDTITPCSPRFGGNRWTIKYRDLRTGKVKNVDNNAAFSSDSCAVSMYDGNICIVYSRNLSPYPSEDCNVNLDNFPDYSDLLNHSEIYLFTPEEGVVLNRPLPGGRLSHIFFAEEGPILSRPLPEGLGRGDCSDFAFSGNALTYTQRNPLTGEKTILVHDLSDFRNNINASRITDHVDFAHSPDISEDENGKVLISYAKSGTTTEITKNSAELSSASDNFSSSSSELNSNSTLNIFSLRDRCDVYLPADFNQDCYVDSEDFAIFANRWNNQEAGLDEAREFASYWLGCTDNTNERCLEEVVSED